MNTNVWAQRALKASMMGIKGCGESSNRRRQRLGHPVGAISMADDPLETWASDANEGLGEEDKVTDDSC